MAPHKNVRILPPGTPPNASLRVVNIRGLEWGSFGRWDRNQNTPTRAVYETVIDAGVYTPGLRNVHVPGYVPGAFTLPLRIDVDIEQNRTLINNQSYPWQRVIVSNPLWGRFDPACVVPGTGISDPQGGRCYFAIEPNLSHILTFLNFRAWLYFGRTGPADIRLGITDEKCRRLQWAGLTVNNCRIVDPTGRVYQNSANNPAKTQHQLDIEMGNTRGYVRIDNNTWTRPADWAPIITTPPPTEVVGHLAGPLTLKRMVLETVNLPPPVLQFEEGPLPEGTPVPPETFPEEDLPVDETPVEDPPQ